MNKKADSRRTITRNTITTAAVMIAACMLMLVTAAPAAAAKPGKASLFNDDMTTLADHLRRIQDAVAEEEEDEGFELSIIGPLQVVPMTPIGDGGAFEPVFPDNPVPGDGGDWEPVFPEDPTPGDDGADEPTEPEQPADDGADEPQDEPEQPADDCADEPTEPEQPADDGADEPQDEPEDEGDDETVQPEEPAEPNTSDDQPALAFTGGDNTPYLIAGAAIVLFGLLALRRRRDESD